MWSSMIFWTLEVTFIDWDPLGPLGPFKQHALQIKSDWSISLQLQGLQTSAMAAAFVQQLLSLHFDDLFSLRLQSPPSKQCLLYLFQCISWWPNTKWEMPNSLLPFLWVAIQKEVQLGHGRSSFYRVLLLLLVWPYGLHQYVITLTTYLRHS